MNQKAEKQIDLTKSGISQFYTIAEVAEHLNVSQRTVRRWVEKNELAHHRIGGLIRISKEDLRSFLAIRRQAP